MLLNRKSPTDVALARECGARVSLPMRLTRSHARLPVYAAGACALGLACYTLPSLFSLDPPPADACRPGNPRWAAMQHDRKSRAWYNRLLAPIRLHVRWCAKGLSHLHARIERIPARRVFGAIVVANVGVFALWYTGSRDTASQRWMRENFTVSAGNVRAGRWWTILTAAFSHRTLDHFITNGLSFLTLAPPVHALLGGSNESFILLYLSGAVLSSCTSVAWSQLTAPTLLSRLPLLLRNHVNELTPLIRDLLLAGPGSLGASGAIYAMLTFLICANPHTKFGVIPAYLYIPLSFLYDIYQNQTTQGPKISIAGHAGGALAGWLYWRWKTSRRRPRQR